jgi:hypothetical protein
LTYNCINEECPNLDQEVEAKPDDILCKVCGYEMELAEDEEEEEEEETTT